MSFELVDTAEAYLVKTPNYGSAPISESEAVSRLPVSSPILTALESPYVDAYFGLKNGEVTVRQWTYSKEKYSKTDVEQLMREKLFKCKRCISLSDEKTRVGEKERMAYVNYMQVGKEVLVAGIGGTMAGAIHFLWLQPQFAGQQIIPGVYTTTVVDLIIAFVLGIVTTMYAKTTWVKILGYGLTGFFTAVGLLGQFGMLPAVSLGAPVRFSAPISTMAPAIASVPRATYQAPVGVVLNKHGSVPQIAPGTYA